MLSVIFCPLLLTSSANQEFLDFIRKREINRRIKAKQKPLEGGKRF